MEPDFKSVWQTMLDKGDMLDVKEIARELTGNGLTVSVCESITGGLVASALTHFAGSSNWMVGGVVAYHPRLKVKLGVQAHTIREFGIVSAQTAQSMADSIRKWSGSTIGVATTGSAGPRALPGSVVGDIWIAVASDGHSMVKQFKFGSENSRDNIRYQATLSALHLTRQFVDTRKQLGWIN